MRKVSRKGPKYALNTNFETVFKSQVWVKHERPRVPVINRNKFAKGQLVQLNRLQRTNKIFNNCYSNKEA